MYQTIVIFIVAFFLAYIFALALAKNKAKKPKKLKKTAITVDKLFVQNKWEGIQETFSLGGPSHFKSAIIEADKLVDFVLKAKGVKGESMGERLKNAKGSFEGYSDYDNLWFAHKVRNNIAHESEHELNSAEAKKALLYYEQALKSLGALPW